MGHPWKYRDPHWKVCIRCYRISPLADYHNSARQPDGKQQYCRECRKEIDAARPPRPYIRRPRAVA